MTAVGIVILYRPFAAFTPAERERLADTITGVAADLKKGASQPNTTLITLAIEEDA